MSGGKYVDSEGHLYTVPIREQGNIYKPNNKAMADEVTEKQVYDAHTKEIDLVNRDPKHLNDDVVKTQRTWSPRTLGPHPRTPSILQQQQQMPVASGVSAKSALYPSSYVLTAEDFKAFQTPLHCSLREKRD
ncbi:caveolin-1 isoform 3 [Mus musculus]|uniref:caveolin-1 isoform 3 n=2 Tax=Mus musculus TaxID=10090 RepID=UPI0020C97558|nr:caveolin-1 isoform 3 [Mus musculus]